MLFRPRMRASAALSLVLLAACGGGGGGHVDPDVSGTSTTLTGANMFTPQSTTMDSQAIGCSTGVLTSGSLDALSAIVTDVDPGTTCALLGGSGNAAVPHVLLLEVATGGYFAADPNAANEPITAGTSFAILNEGVTDEDLCGNVPASTTTPTAIAMLEQCPTPTTCSTMYWATAGSITVNSVNSSAVAGSFQLTLGDESSDSAGGTLSGTFDGLACP
jgi:hypothetical protein